MQIQPEESHWGDICRDPIGPLEWRHQVHRYDREPLVAIDMGKKTFITSVIIVPALTLSPLGAKALAGTVKIKFWPCIYLRPALKSLTHGNWWPGPCFSIKIVFLSLEIPIIIIPPIHRRWNGGILDSPRCLTVRLSVRLSVEKGFRNFLKNLLAQLISYLAFTFMG